MTTYGMFHDDTISDILFFIRTYCTQQFTM